MRSLLRIAVLCLLIATTIPAQALDTATRAVGPVMHWDAQALADFDPSWLHLKLVEGSGARLEAGRLVSDQAQLEALNTLLADAITLRRTFPGDTEHYAELKRRGEAASGKTGPDLSLWFDLRLAPERGALAARLEALNALDVVEIAHPAPICETAGITAKAGAGERALPSPDFSGQQDYLYVTPVGLDAPAAWAQPGGRGAGTHFIDVEIGWVLNHEDFNAANHFYQGGAPLNPSYFDHGTAVMGEVVGMNDGSGVTGFASDASWGVVAIDVDEWPDVPHYFQEAIDNLNAGDVWLIELQMYPPGRDATPMEWLQVNYDVIWTGCWAQNVVCIEAGANGSQNLDDASWGGVFDRNIRDSGAIMVGAGTPTGRVAEWFTNYGDRMDVHAWGSSIVTTGYGDLYYGGSSQTEYTATFGGTSGASPMVTGASLCLQGIHRIIYGTAMTPSALRDLLNSTGIPHLDTNQEIGPRPDLGAAVLEIADLTAVENADFASTLRVNVEANPFRSEARLSFSQPHAGSATLSIYDARGRRVRVIEAGAAGAGERQLSWDGKDAAGREMGSGVYLYSLETEGEKAGGRMVRLR